MRDPDIAELVHTAQLKLVLISDFPEHYTFCPSGGTDSGRSADEHPGSMRNRLSPAEEVGCCAERCAVASGSAEKGRADVLAPDPQNVAAYGQNVLV